MSSKKRRKSQTKRGHQKGARRIKADEVFHHGPLTIARYGRYIEFSNNSTPEEHKEFLERAKKTHSETLEELKAEVPKLQAMVQRYDPVELMHRAAYMLLPLFMKYRSENEFSPAESYALPTVEYLQYLVARTPFRLKTKKPEEKEWEELWTQAIKVMKLTDAYNFTRAATQDSLSEIDRLIFEIDSRRLLVRVKHYPVFLPEYLRTSLAPFDAQIQKQYGLNVDELIEGIRKIDEYQKRGVTTRYKEFVLATAKLARKLEAAGYSTDEKATPDEMKKTKLALEDEPFKKLRDDAQEKARLTLTTAIFDITDLTSLPKKLLSLLSVKPGESVLQKLTGPKDDDLSPLSNSELHDKPFLEVKSRFYTFYHSGFEDHIAEIIQAELFRNSTEAQRTKMEKDRSDHIEKVAGELLVGIVNADFALQNLYYPNPDQAGNAELDLLLGVDDILFIVEVKSGAISEGAARGAPLSLASNLSELILEGQRQSERAERYIKSKDEVEFFDKTGKIVVHKIKASDYRRVFRVVITKEDLGWIGAKLAVLSVIDPNLSGSLPWHISIDDLRAVAELFSDSSIRFVHYLEQRLIAGSVEQLEQHDEIEHVALYNKINLYHELPIKDTAHITFNAAYMRDIDFYFAERNSGKQPDIPNQEMPPRMRQLVNVLGDSGIAGRFEVGSSILLLDTQGRQQLDQALQALEEAASQGRQVTVRLPITDYSFGISLSVAKDGNWQKELIRSAAQMEQGNCKLWLAVQLSASDGYKVLNIERIKPGQFSEAELEVGRRALEERTQAAIKGNKVGRNEKCPCGSGKKFKRCHGSLV